MNVDPEMDRRVGSPLCVPSEYPLRSIVTKRRILRDTRPNLRLRPIIQDEFYRGPIERVYPYEYVFFQWVTSFPGRKRL